MSQVAVSGAGGKLGTAIAAGVAATDDLELSGLYNPNRVGEEMMGIEVVGEFDQVQADVLVETCHPDQVYENLEGWREQGFSVVVGTSGFTEERLAKLHQVWGGRAPGCLVVPNFSIGAVLMMRFAAEAARHFETAEIIERHHATKPDSPSGTALATATRIATGGALSDERSQELVSGARGADVLGVRVHSVRLPGVIAQHEVVLSNAGEVLTVEHTSTSYDSFVPGALAAIRGVGKLEGVHIGLDAVL